MLTIWMLSVLLAFIPTILLIFSLLISKKMTKNFEKSSPFECGFDPLSLTRPPFSIQFFLISIMFLIFDIEITLLIPLIIMTSKLNNWVSLSAFFFLTILLLGLLYEFLEKSIEWKN